MNTLICFKIVFPNSTNTYKRKNTGTIIKFIKNNHSVRSCIGQNEEGKNFSRDLSISSCEMLIYGTWVYSCEGKNKRVRACVKDACTS